MRVSLFEPFVEVDLALPDRRDGKVRASWAVGDQQRLIVTTDRLSAFDRVLAGVPYKGQVLNQISAWWFAQTADLVANHVVSVPDPNALLAVAAQPLPVARTVDQADVAPTHFVVRQYFMRSPAEEQALLTALSRQLERHDIAVTFNGRSFDLPLLRNRIRYNLRFLPDFARGVPLLHERAPHLDLLMPARRLWKRRLQSCRLANLEQKVLEFVRTEDDVPGRLIPQLYIDYLRSGDARPLQRVFYHNREDIVSMVALADHLTRAFGSQTDSAQEVELPAADWIALGISYDSQGRNDLAESAYRRALEFTADPHDRAELFARLARLMKRQGRWQEAADAWQAWLSSTPGVDPTPFVELAKYCEWQLNDYDQAEMWTACALYNLQQQDARLAWARTISELEHRLDRIRRKKRTASS